MWIYLQRVSEILVKCREAEYAPISPILGVRARVWRIIRNFGFCVERWPQTRPDGPYKGTDYSEKPH